MEADQLLKIPAERLLLKEDKLPMDEQISKKLRPRTWEQFVGHDNEKLLLIGNPGKEEGSWKRRGLLPAAKERGEIADHMLLSGPAGLGKTALSTLIQEELGQGTQVPSGMTGPAFQATIVSLRARSVMFVDEVHSLKPLAMEALQIGMEGGVIAWNRTAPPFTLIAATTKFGKLPDTLRDRFGLVLHLRYYNEKETAEIASRSAEKLNMELRPKSAEEIAVRARGVPRIANRLLRRVRDVTDSPSPQRVARTMAELGIDSWGFDEGDRQILMLMHHRFGGGPVGVRTLAAAAGQEERTLVEGFEPFLLRKGIIDIVPRGRQLTEKGHIYCRQVVGT